MDTQSESCEPPPCDPQPPGKIRKALKLFSKRKPGSSVASIFSMRGKGEGGPKSPPSRSKTLEGLTETVAPEAEAESVDLEQEDSQKEDVPKEGTVSREGNLGSTPTRQSISSITSAKSLSFLNMLRRTRRGGGGERLAQTESQRPGRQRKGLKGLFGSVRWHGKDKEGSDEVEPGPPLLASRSNSVEIIKENLTLTPRPVPRSPDESEIEQQPSHSQDEPTSSEDTTKVSESARPATNDRLSTLLGDISSILSFDSLTGGGDIVADVEAEWVKVSSRVEGTDEISKKDKTLSAAVSTKYKPTLSPTSTLSSTASTKPSPTSATKPISSLTASPKPTSSPTTKPTLSSASTPSPTISVIPTPPPTSATIFSSTAKLHPSSPPTPAPSPIPSTKPTPISLPITKPAQSPKTTATSAVSTQPALIPASTITTEPATKPTPSPSPAPTPAAVPETSISPTVESPPELAAPTAVRTEPTPTPPATAKPAPTPAPTSATKPIHSAAQESKHSSASAPKYPPFSTSTKPTPTAPATRPKIVTTFGLSTSRNTAPIIKPETKQPAPQTKSSPPLSQTKTPTESGPPHAAKPPPAVSPATYVPPGTKPQPTISKPTAETATSQPIPATSSATSVKPAYKQECVDASLLSGSPPLPILTSSPRPGPTIAPSFSTAPIGEKELEDVIRRRGVEETGTHTWPQKVEPQPVAQDQLPIVAHKPEKKSSAVKPTALSKIPVSGGGRPKQHHRDGQANGDEGHWNLPTPVHEGESPISLSRESSSKDPLSDFSIGSGAVTPTLSHSHEDILDSAARQTMGATSLSRESKIPIKHGSTATYHSLVGKTDTARSKIPVSKVPVRRTSNKPAPTATATATRK
ncbi:APC membrane recruitment protein 2 [Pygocentrus nattereri]|uniref:APC membrane recruitment protein 2 n=1 Tax=Pygocentrus nattereri TaxID=42514 RepID=UPI0008144DAF|nr:APC membrane recruitment protein 2 [Pygocentrus nattereri]